MKAIWILHPHQDRAAKPYECHFLGEVMITIDTALLGSLSIGTLRSVEHASKRSHKVNKTAKNIFTAICANDDQPIAIDEALKIRDKTCFICDDCGHRLRAHKRSKNGANAHFEHFIKNPFCKY